MNKIEMLNELKARQISTSEILDKIKLEKRQLSNVEETTLDTNKTTIEELEKRIKELDEKPVIMINKNNKNNSMEKFSLLRSIRDIVEGRNFSDSTLNILDYGKEDFKKAGLSYRGQLVLPTEYRTGEVLAGTAEFGKEIVTEDKFALLPYLRANSVLVQAGATLLTGLQGDVSIPYIGTGSTSNWKSEAEIAAQSSPMFGEITMSPKRLTTYVDISKQFLIQDSIQAEQMLRNDIISSLVDKLEATILGTAAGAASYPAGMFYGATYTVSGATSWSGIVSLESAVAAQNSLKGSAAYIIHPTTLGVAKTTGKATNQAIFIAEGNSINGYPYFTTTNLPAGSVTNYKLALFGVMSDLVIGQWGGLDLTVDNYSQAIYGKVRVVVNAYFDAAKRRSTSFAYASLG